MPKVHHGFGSFQLKRKQEADYPIVKSNHIVQYAHYSMPLYDQKVLASMIRSIKPKQKTLTVKFNVVKFARMLGIKESSRSLSYVMGAIQRVDNDNFWIKEPNGDYDLWNWLEGAHVSHRNRYIVTVKFNPKLRRYLLSKSKKYRTIYEFSDIMLMRNRYSPRLYEIFKSNMSRQPNLQLGIDYDLNELRYALNLMKRAKSAPHRIKLNKHGGVEYRYSNFSDFNRRILKPAVIEINKLTQYHVWMSQIKGRHNKVTGINIRMIKKSTADLVKRDDLQYYIINHVPKAERPHWKKMAIKGLIKPAGDDKFAESHNLIRNNKGQYFVPDSEQVYHWVNRSQAEMILKVDRFLKKKDYPDRS